MRLDELPSLRRHARAALRLALWQTNEDSARSERPTVSWDPDFDGAWVFKITPGRLMRMKGVGQATLAQISRALEKQGLRLGRHYDGVPAASLPAALVAQICRQEPGALAVARDLVIENGMLDAWLVASCQTSLALGDFAGIRLFPESSSNGVARWVRPGARVRRSEKWMAAREDDQALPETAVVVGFRLADERHELVVLEDEDGERYGVLASKFERAYFAIDPEPRRSTMRRAT